MADIFISYARSTAKQAEQIAQALRALGYGVWRDDELPAHRAYAEVIEERLRAAKAVVVIWSGEATRSEWVRSEADRARNERKLVQLTVDGAPLPMPFDQVQCADLSAWRGEADAPGWRKVVASIADLVGSVSPASELSAPKERADVSICVLPFANMSGDQEQEYFSDGISEDITTDLSRISGLSVISRNSAFTFKGKAVNVQQVARELNVSHIVEGSVRKSGGRVRITAQLIDARQDCHIWADRYDRDLSDIFTLQDEISEAIVSALKLKLLPEEKEAIEDRGTSNVEAYDKYLRARSLLYQSGSAELLRAAEIYREVLALDPEFALAWYGLYRVLSESVFHTPEIAIRARQEMAEASAQIAALAPKAWWNHAMRSDQLSQQRKWSEAEEAGRLAVATAPASEAEASRVLAILLVFIGRIDEALGYLKQVRQVDPLSLSVSNVIQIALCQAGRRAQAQAEYERSKDLSGGRGRTEFVALTRLWSRADADPAAIRAQFDMFLKHETVFMTLNEAMAHRLDDKEAARTAIRQAFDDPANQDEMRMSIIARYADHYGDKDLALTALRRQIIDMNGMALYALWWPYETGLRSDPRFKEIVRGIGLYDYWRKSGKWGDFARPLGDDDFEIVR